MDQRSNDLSESALALFRRHVERKARIPVDDTTREAYRELARHGLMIVGHSFVGGRESFYAMSETGAKLAKVLPQIDAIATSPGESASPRP